MILGWQRERLPPPSDCINYWERGHKMRLTTAVSRRLAEFTPISISFRLDSEKERAELGGNVNVLTVDVRITLAQTCEVFLGPSVRAIIHPSPCVLIFIMFFFSRKLLDFVSEKFKLMKIN